MIPRLAPAQPFPDVGSALRVPNGLLAATHDLTPQRLVDAYARGIFPWYAPGEPVLWWSPDPRMVLYTGEFRVSRSLRRTLRRVAAGSDGSIGLSVDRAFACVMRECAAPRDAETGTWITPAVMAAYGALHDHGLAHSVEVWVDGELAGGLYGVCLGRMFYGESMFARATDASKVALAALVGVLRSEGVAMIDCQQNTRHLASLGGREIAREDFCAHVQRAVQQPAIDWTPYRTPPEAPDGAALVRPLLAVIA